MVNKSATTQREWCCGIMKTMMCVQKFLGAMQCDWQKEISR
jgi:hypothetical protein